MFEFYEMKRDPFGKGIDVEHLYFSKNANEAYHRLMYAAQNQEIAVMCGVTGSGKSGVLRKVRAALPKEEYDFLYIAESMLSPSGLYRTLLAEIGCEPVFFKDDARYILQKELLNRHQSHGKKTVCIIDEAQMLVPETVTELRFFMNMDIDSQSPAALILSGQNTLIENLKLQVNKSFYDRIDRFAFLSSLDRADVARYIRSHLEYAEGRQDIFNDKALDSIYKYSYGIPRKINHICLNCLIYGAQNKKPVLDEYDVDSIVKTELVEG